MSGGLTGDGEPWVLKDLIKRLEERYCGKIGYQYMHIQDRSVRNWIRDKVEKFEHFDRDKLLRTGDRLLRDYVFVKFL